MDKRYQIESIDSEINNLSLLAEYGKAAWAEDNAAAAQMLADLEAELLSATGRLAQVEAQRNLKEEKMEKQLALAEKDLFNYMRNSGKTLVEIRALEHRAREILDGLESDEIEKLESEMNTIW